MTAFFRAMLGLNRGTRAAGILIGLPVCGFRPFLAARRDVIKVPNPTRETRLPRRKESRTDARTAFSAFSSLAFEFPEAFAIATTNSAFVILSPPFDVFRPKDAHHIAERSEQCQ